MTNGGMLAAGLGIAALAGVAYAVSTHKDDDAIFPPPADDRPCYNAVDVNTATAEILADQSMTPNALRDAANVLRHKSNFCDQVAVGAAQASIALLEARANELEGKGNIPLPPGVPPINFPPTNYYSAVTSGTEDDEPCCDSCAHGGPCTGCSNG